MLCGILGKVRGMWKWSRYIDHMHKIFSAWIIKTVVYLGPQFSRVQSVTVWTKCLLASGTSTGWHLWSWRECTGNLIGRKAGVGKIKGQEEMQEQGEEADQGLEGVWWREKRKDVKWREAKRRVWVRMAFDTFPQWLTDSRENPIHKGPQPRLVHYKPKFKSWLFERNLSKAE